MREIKCKAWDKKTKTIREVHAIVFADRKSYPPTDGNGLPHVVQIWGKDIIEDRDIILTRGAKDVDLVWFTGLKDKNGKEIYEGDILLEETDGARPFVIEWEKEQWVEDGFVVGFTCLTSGANCYKIIGNIYENP